jgi:hypothetical protein
MATVKDPLHSIQARGSVEGVTYSLWRGLNTARRKARPVRRARRSQPNNRSILGQLARMFSDLTIPQMEAWENWATNHPEGDKYGGTFLLSAIQAFIKLNHTAFRLFGVKYDDPPVADPVAACDTLAVAAGLTPGDCDLTWTHIGTGVAADLNEVQIAGPFMSKGRRSVFSRFRYIEDVAGNLLVDTVGGLTEQMWYWFRVRYIDMHGMVTNWVYGQGQPAVTP